MTKYHGPILTGDVEGELTEVPSYLIRDEFDGMIFPYRGVKKVLAGELEADTIMGCSGPQTYHQH